MPAFNGFKIGDRVKTLLNTGRVGVIKALFHVDDKEFVMIYLDNELRVVGGYHYKYYCQPVEVFVLA